jgi:rhamnogalacturonyl hydrolase YesR
MTGWNSAGARALLAAVVVAVLCASSAPARADSGSTLSREQILADMEWMASAQLAALGEQTPIDWEGATMYAGLADLARVSSKPAYGNALLQMGKKTGWRPLHNEREPHNADRIAIGQAILAVYADKRDPAIIEPLKTIKLDPLVEHLKQTAADTDRLVWSWCDALFMGAPAMTRMSALTGDRKYVDAMDREWWKVMGKLYDTEEHLVYRDERFIKPRSKNGKKVFWSRGDGWVMAALPRVLSYLPEDYPTRGKYVEVFRQMAERLASIQGADGLWRSSLLDPAEYPGPEASGTAFFCYGIAWGINQGLLDKQKYLPVVTKAWAGLLAARRPDGLLGFVQDVSDQPGPTRPDTSKWYATGAFLMAGTELMKLAPLELPPSPALPGARPLNRAFARYVPERKDDIAWENDRIAFRIYGPQLYRDEPPPRSGSGVDVWAKSTPRPIVDEWYRTGDYHADRGDGLDFYKVGAARGCGGLGIWRNDKLHVSADWHEHRILAAGPNLASFRVTYAPWDAGGGRKVWERRTVWLESGSNLNRVESLIESDDPADLIVGIGISRRPIEGVAQDGQTWQDKDRGILGTWSAPDPKNGSIGCGVVVDPAAVAGFARDDLNDLVLIKVTPGKRFVYYAGATWSKAPNLNTPEAWQAYLKDFEPE